MNPELLILVGPPCSGKSTYARTRSKDGFYIVSRDDFRTSLFGEYRMGNNKEEKLITELVRMTVVKLLSEGSNVTLDNTHIKEKYINLAVRDYNDLADISVVFMDKVAQDELLERNGSRAAKTGKMIPEFVIESMDDNYSKLIHNYSGNLFYPKTI